MIENITDRQLTRASLVCVALSILLGMFAVFYHESKRVISPDDLLWSSLTNALNTSSVTTYTKDSDNTQETKQTNDIRYVPSLSVHSMINVATNSGGKVTSETYGDPTTDLVRYTAFEGPTSTLNPVIKDVWGLVPLDQGADGTLLSDVLSSSNILIGHFDANTRGEIENSLRQSGVYSSTSLIAASEQVDEQNVSIIRATIKPDAYNSAIKNHLKRLGLEKAAANIPEQSSANDITAEFAINRSSRQIVMIGIPTLAATRAIHFTGWDRNDIFPKPSTYITYDELQQHLLIQRQ